MRRSNRAPGTTFRTAVVPVTLSGADYRRAHQACHHAGLLWNHLLSALRDHWKAEQRDPSTKQLRQHIATAPEAAQRLHAHTKQAAVDDLFDAVALYRSSQRAGLHSKAPWRMKNYRPLEFTARYGWRINAQGRLSMSLGRGRPPIVVKQPVITDPATGEIVDPSQWGGLRLCWDRMGRSWSVHIAVPTQTPPPGNPDIIMAIDEGIINPMTTAIETDDAYVVEVINGRHARAIKHYRNTRVAKLAKKRSRCTRGSRRYKKLTRTMRGLESETRKRLHNIDHQVSRKAANAAQKHRAGTIIVGDVRGIEQSTKQAERRRTNRHQRRRLSQWSRGKQETLLGHKTKISIGHLNEAYSSQTCPACLLRNRPTGRQYQCRQCSFTCHRDAVGALNILMRAQHGQYTPIDPDKPIKITYLRATPITVTRSNAQNRASSTAGEADPILLPNDTRQLAVSGVAA